MNYQKLMQIKIIVGVVFVFLLGCTNNVESTSGSSSPTNIDVPPTLSPTSTATLTLTDTPVPEYVAVLPSEIQCGLSSSGRIEQRSGEDGKMQVSGTIDELICEGKTVPLKNNDIVNSFLETEDFGRIKLEMNPGTFSFQIFMLPEDKERLIDWAAGN